MSMAGSNAAFAVYPSSDGAMFILPDGSLWRWGAGFRNTARPPELFDDQHHWAKAFNRTDQWMEQDTDGDVWEEGRGPSKLSPLPVTNRDWVDLTGGVMYALGLKRDGTILGWELNFARTGQTNPITEVQTNFLWRAVSANGPACMGVSSDGRLWTWDRQRFSPLTFTQPTLASANTNWVGVAAARYAWSSSGELWGAPVARLNSPNAIPGRFALGSIVHEIRSDGTLWAIGTPGPPMTRRIAGGGTSFGFYSGNPGPNGNGLTSGSGNLQWRKIGERSDWVSIWGSDETYYGLTYDGTVWVWGADWGQEPIKTFKETLTYLWEEICDHFQSSSSGTGPLSGRPAMMLTQPYQDEPRPLMRFKSVNK
jgi:alpha-tubulin suppressor-like RCC1 family protein